MDQDSRDYQLVVRLRAGDEGAYEELYESYSPLLFGLILRIVGDPNEAENLLQDCFIKIWQNIALYSQDKGRLATWLINIARNTAIDFTRSKYFNQKQKNQTIENFVHTVNQNTITTPCFDTLGLRQLVDKLHPQCRVVIELMYFKGYTQQEISDLFGIPLGTVKSRARMALMELKSYYH